MMIDPFRLCVMALPLAVYFLFLGWINLRRRPTIFSGSIDTALLCVAILGLAVVGPMELFFPETAAAQFRHFNPTWPMLLALYGLSASLVILMSRPRFVISNATAQQLRPLISEVGSRLDPEARWAGDSLSLPQLGVQLRIEEFAAMRNVSLIANSNQQNLAGWRRMGEELESSLTALNVTPNPRGVSLLMCGALTIALCIYRSLGDLPALAQGLRDLLRV